MTFEDFRAIDIDLDGANSYIAPIIASSGDSKGRRLRVTLTKHGDTIAPTDTMSGRLLFDTQPTNPDYFGDAVAMDKTATGFEVDIPNLPLRSASNCVPMSVAIIDTQGEGDTATRNIVCSRDFTVLIQRGGVKSGGEDGGAGLLEDAIKRAEDAADRATDATADVQAAREAAEASKKSADDSAASATASATSAGKSADSATAAAGSATEAAQHATAAADSATASQGSADKSAASATAAATSAKAAQDAVDNFDLRAGTTTTTEPGTNAAVRVTKTGTVYTADFDIPRGDKGENTAAINSFNVTVDDTVGTPKATTTMGGTPENRDITVAITGLKGRDGVDGTDGTNGRDGYSTRAVEGDILSGATVPLTKIHPADDIKVGDTLIDGNGDAYSIATVTADNVTVGNAMPDFSLKGPAGAIENLLTAAPITGDGTTTPLTVATATPTTVGVVKPGTGLTLGDDGTINATTYTLPTASATVVGGVKVGDNLAITHDGTLSATAQPLTPATKTALGGVMIGDGIDVTPEGVISSTATGVTSVTVDFAPADFAQGDDGIWTATKTVAGLGTLNLATPVAGWDNVQAYSAAAPIIVDHDDDTSVAEGSVMAMCQSAPATSFTVRLIIVAK